MPYSEAVPSKGSGTSGCSWGALSAFPSPKYLACGPWQRLSLAQAAGQGLNFKPHLCLNPLTYIQHLEPLSPPLAFKARLLLGIGRSLQPHCEEGREGVYIHRRGNRGLRETICLGGEVQSKFPANRVLNQGLPGAASPATRPQQGVLVRGPEARGRPG